MAISNFLTTVWSTRINTTLRDMFILAQPNVVNRNYEPDVNDARSFHAHTLEDIAVETYDTDPANGVNKFIATSDTGGYTNWIKYKELKDRRVTGTMDQEKIVPWFVEDIARLQSNANYMNQMTQNAGYRLSEEIETFLAGRLEAGIADSDNTFGTGHVFTPTNYKGLNETNRGIDDDVTEGYALADGRKLDLVSGTKVPAGGEMFLNTLVDVNVRMTKDYVPKQGRVLIVPPEFAYTVWASEKLDKDTNRSEMSIANGWIGRLQGFDVFESNHLKDDGSSDANTPAAGTATWCIATHPSLYTFAMQQPIKFEVMRSENRMAWAVRACAVYGGVYLNRVKPEVSGTAKPGACKILVDTVNGTQVVA